jgi:hypothetical protein
VLEQLLSHCHHHLLGAAVQGLTRQQLQATHGPRLPEESTADEQCQWLVALPYLVTVHQHD